LAGFFDGSKQQPRLRDGQDITSSPEKVQRHNPLAARGRRKVVSRPER
jgi:hypothetical protein